MRDIINYQDLRCELVSVHISEIVPGDTIFHEGDLKTVTRTNISYSDFMGKDLFGDSYMLGRKLVQKVISFGANIKERKDQQGRNNVNTLRYYAGFMRLLERGYKNLNIHEKITVRSAYCGAEFPSVMISTLN